MKRLVSRVCAAACLAAVVLVPGTLHAQAKRAITHIAGDLYRFQNNFHFSVFLVTPEGVIATDPINAEAAIWLEAEIDKRFGRPIKYLILSHDHADHSSGGEVFADTATVIAHDRAKAGGLALARHRSGAAPVRLRQLRTRHSCRCVQRGARPDYQIPRTHCVRAGRPV